MESSEVLELRRLLTCPICLTLIQDPCIISTCQHCFCYACINRGIEYGCAPCSLPFEPLAEGAEGEGTTAKRKKRRAKSVKFECPVCGMAAFKWMLQRVATLTAFINRVRLVMCTVPLTPPPPPYLHVSVAPIADDNASSPREPNGAPPLTPPMTAPGSDVPPSYPPSGGSVALFDESMPLWAQATESIETKASISPNVPAIIGLSSLAQSMSNSSTLLQRCVDTPSGISDNGEETCGDECGDTTGASRGIVLGARLGSTDTTEPSLAAFLRTPPPASPLKAHDDQQLELPALPQLAASSPAPDRGASVAASSEAIPSSCVAASAIGDALSYDRLLSPVHLGRTSLEATTTSTTRRPPRDSPIRFVPQPVSVLLDASIWGINDSIARAQYLDVVHLAASRLGGTVVNAVVPESLTDLCGAPSDTSGARSPLTIRAASHLVCLVDPANVNAAVNSSLSAGRCEASLPMLHAPPQVVGLEWVVESLERGAWQLDRPQQHPTADSSWPFAGLGIVVDLGVSSANVTSDNAVDVVVMRKVQGAIRLAALGGASAIWIAWVTSSGETQAQRVKWALDAPTNDDDGIRRDLFDASSPFSVDRTGAQLLPVQGVMVLSLAGNARDAAMQPSTLATLLAQLPLRDHAGIPVARRTIDWWYRILLVDGMSEWTAVRSSLLRGGVLEWEHQRPRSNALLYDE